MQKAGPIKNYRTCRKCISLPTPALSGSGSGVWSFDSLSLSRDDPAPPFVWWNYIPALGKSQGVRSPPRAPYGRRMIRDTPPV